MEGKICIVTGANSGIGKAAATEIAARGAHVVMICRNKEKAEGARREIIAKSGNSHVDVLLADLSIQSEVRRVAREFKGKYDRLDVLLNNAGFVNGKRTLTPDGFEVQFATNHLGPFLLTHELLDLLKARPKARIVTVSSGGHWFGKIDFENLNGERSWNGWLQYCNTKLENILFTKALAKRLEGSHVTANCLHPGGVGTNFASGTVPEWGRRVAARFMLTPEQGAQTSIYLCCSPEVEEVSGEYFAKCRVARTSRRARDAALGEKLWAKSAELCGVDA